MYTRFLGDVEEIGILLKKPMQGWISNARKTLNFPQFFWTIGGAGGWMIIDFY